MATAGFCIHYKEFSFHLQEFKINSVFNLPRSSSFLLPVCAFADPRSVVTSGRLLSMLACCVLKWLLSPCHVKAGGLTRAYLIFGRERTTSKASCYSYEVFPIAQQPLTLSYFFVWLYQTFALGTAAWGFFNLSMPTSAWVTKNEEHRDCYGEHMHTHTATHA
jgi:hypothetical protein